MSQFADTGGGTLGNVTVSIPAVGNTDSPAPNSAIEIGGVDPSGNLVGLLTNSDGALIVSANGSFAVQTVVISYNEVSSVPVGVETVINTFVAPSGFTSYLLSIVCSGQNIGQFNIYLNGVLFDRQYLSYTLFNILFDYKTNSSSVPGFVMNPGDILSIKAINSGLSSTLFNARIMILEVN